MKQLNQLKSQVNQSVNQLKNKKASQYIQNFYIRCKYRSRQILPPCLTWSTIFLLEIFIIIVILQMNVKIVKKTNEIESIYYKQSVIPASFVLDYPSIPYLAYNASNVHYHYNDSIFDYSSSTSFYLSLLYTNYLHDKVNLESNTYVLVHTNGLKNYIEEELRDDCPQVAVEEKQQKFKNQCNYYKQFGGYNALPLDIMAYKETPQKISILPKIEITLNSTNDQIVSKLVDVYLNVTVNGTFTQVKDIKLALKNYKVPLIVNFADYRRCRNIGTMKDDVVICTNQINKNGEYGVDSLQSHNGKLSSSVIIGWNEQGFIVRSDELGHTKEYYFGQISGTEDMYICGNTYSFKSWISYSDYFREFNSTILKYRKNERFEKMTNQTLDVNKQYVICGDGMKATVDYSKGNGKYGSITLMEYDPSNYIINDNNKTVLNGTKYELYGWEEIFETILYPANQQHGVLELEQCFYDIIPYSAFFDSHAHADDRFGLIGVKSYNIQFLNNTLPQNSYSTYNIMSIDGAYNIKTGNPENIKPVEPIPDSSKAPK